MSLKMRLPPGPLPGVPFPLGDVTGGTSAPATGGTLGSRRRIVLVRDALDVLAPVRFELRLDPVDGVTIALRALPAIAELRQSFDRVLVSLEIEAIDEGLYRVVRRIGRRYRRHCADENDGTAAAMRRLQPAAVTSESSRMRTLRGALRRDYTLASQSAPHPLVDGVPGLESPERGVGVRLQC